MRKRILWAGSAVIIAAAAFIVVAQNHKQIRAVLTGYEEVPTVSTGASGELRARISNDATRVDYELSYSDLEGAVTQAHVHFGAAGTNGGISVWLCGNVPNTPAGIQPCPPPPATISGSFDAGDVTGPANQGIAAGEFGELIRAMRAGKTYVNVHSTLFPGGEIRSQIDPGGRDHSH